MKKLYVLTCLCLSALWVDAQTIQFTSVSNGTNKIQIPDGQKWKITSLALQFDAELFSGTNQVSQIGVLRATQSYLYGGDSAPSYGVGVILIGPVNLKVSQSGTYYLAFEKSTNLPSDYSLSSTAVVIPTSASGDVDVKMEQSADNVTWTECLPGTYNSSTVKRFFRLRAVEK